MYTEICPELGEAIAATSSAPYIQFNLICVSLLEAKSHDDREWPLRLNARLNGIYSLLMGQSRVKMTFVHCIRVAEDRRCYDN